jgi:hypothetical protein
MNLHRREMIKASGGVMAVAALSSGPAWFLENAYSATTISILQVARFDGLVPPISIRFWAQQLRISTKGKG